MEECAICLEVMKTDVTLLSCLHKFHTLCILNNRMIYRKHHCPICREEARFVARCNLKYNDDCSVSYSPYKDPKMCCNIM